MRAVGVRGALRGRRLIDLTHDFTKGDQRDIFPVDSVLARTIIIGRGRVVPRVRTAGVACAREWHTV